MHAGAGTSSEHEVRGTLHFSDLEGGFWSLELDASHPQLGDEVVLQDWSPTPPLADGTHVAMRVREQSEQFGFLMAGTMVEVLAAAPA